MAPLSPTRSRKRVSETKNNPENFHGMAPFPNDIATAPLLRISLEKLLNGDGEEREKLWKACCDLGFFYLDLRSTLPVGSGNNGNPNGYGGSEVNGEVLLRLAEELFLVQKSFFKIPVEEKQQYDYKEKGSYFGYKGYGSATIDRKGNKDRNEFFNISKDDILGQAPRIPSPPMLDPHRPLVESFMRSSHMLVSFILTLLNARLGLPDGKLTSLHRLSAISGDQVRFIRAPPQPKDDRRVALGEHTDFGSVTILFNRIGGLQVKLPKNVEPLQPAEAPASTEKTGSSNADDQRWVYVRPLPGHAIVNLGDAMVKFTAGILRSNIHRVAAPPGAQAVATRYSLVYFARPEDDVLLKVLRGSPLIEEALRNRVDQPGDVQEEAITSKEWILRRALGRRNGDKWEYTLGTEDRDEVGVGYR